MADSARATVEHALDYLKGKDISKEYSFTATREAFPDYPAWAVQNQEPLRKAEDEPTLET
jgi:di/tripeptidase